MFLLVEAIFIYFGYILFKGTQVPNNPNKPFYYIAIGISGFLAFICFNLFINLLKL